MLVCTNCILGASQAVLVVKNLPANAGNIRDVGSIPGSARAAGGVHGKPLQNFWPGEFLASTGRLFPTEPPGKPGLENF